MTCLVFLIEGPSERDALEAWLPRLVASDVVVRFIQFEGKQDMEKRMASKMRDWLFPDSRFIVLRDQDSADCSDVKRALKARCIDAGRPDAIVRIACHELESFFLGDWAAVARAFNKPGLTKLDAKAVYRRPDDIAAPVQELKRHIPTYQKRDGARRIAPHMALSGNRSKSFQALIAAIRAAVA